MERLESNETNRGLLENVVITTEGSGESQYIRIPENSQIIGTELLQQHNGIVVDLNGSEFIPVSYSSEDLLSQDLTEEDRNLAAALVAVQLSQQQKQQQLQDSSLPTLVGDQPLLIADKSGHGGYLRIVNSENLYVEQQETGSNQLVHAPASSQITIVKSEEDQADSDRESVRNDHRTSKKSLPHKKRISRKLRKNSSAASNKKVVCNLCEQSFNNNDDFVQHELLCQTTITPVNPSPFACQICNIPFQDQLRFFEHLKSHYEPPKASPEKEPVSQPQPPTPTKAEKKSSSSHNENANQETLLSSLLSLTCIECNKTFRRQKTFEAHMRDVHTNKTEPIDEFSEPEDLMAGIDVVVDDTHNDDDEAEDDTKAWYREEELHQTEEDLKDIEEKNNEHVCHICKQPFPLRAILLQHLVTCRATSGNTEPTPAIVVRKKNRKMKEKEKLNCPECDRSFKHRNSLVYHMRSHTGIRPHQCELCGKSFFASSALKVHLRLHSGDKPYDCEHCGRKFRQWGDLKYHITSIHSNEKNYQCEYCGKEFARKYSLIVHRRIHTGERNYKCDYCGKCFRASSYLQNHRKIHTGEKPHSCSICSKPFRVRSDMKRHERTHGKGGHKQPNSRSLKTVVQKEEIEDNDESNELHIGEDEEAAEHILGVSEYSSEDPLVESATTTTVRIPNRNLYINGHELFLVTYPNEIAARTAAEGANTTTWIHTADS